MEKVNKSYYAIIPANVRYDDDLPAFARLLYGEITALCNEKGYCWATNNYFAELYKTTDRSIQRWLNALADKGYIEVKLASGYQRKIYLKGTTKLSYPPTELSPPHDRNVVPPTTELSPPHDRNVVHNNTYNNTTNNTVNNVYVLYSTMCPSLPKTRVLSANRKRAINTLLKEFSEEDISKAFTLAEESDFLKGQNDTGWTATFDWLIKKNNLLKVLEGNYANKNIRIDKTKTDLDELF